MFTKEQYTSAIASKCNLNPDDLNVKLSIDGVACYESLTDRYYTECHFTKYKIMRVDDGIIISPLIGFKVHPLYHFKDDSVLVIRPDEHFFVLENYSEFLDYIKPYELFN